MDLKNAIRTIPDWPKPGIMFRDITTLLLNPEAFSEAVRRLADHFRSLEFDAFAAIESRGFIFGGALAIELGKELVLIRKPRKLPGKTVREEYQLEYGTDAIEVHEDAIRHGERIIVLDDLLATGGTALAAIRLCERLGAKIVETAFIVDLPEIGGRNRIEKTGVPVFHLVEFEGE